jgi:hypothetical protein
MLKRCKNLKEVKHRNSIQDSFNVARFSENYSELEIKVAAQTYRKTLLKKDTLKEH